MLEDYRGFRHVVRNVYTYHLSPEKLEKLIVKIDIVMKKLSAELSFFADLLKESDSI